MNSNRLPMFVSLALLLAPSSALAADPPGTVPAAAAPAPAPAADPGAPAGALPPPPVNGATTPAPATTHEDPEFAGARYRWGIAPFGGAMFAGGSTVGAGGLGLRFGAQITREFGVYAQPVLMVGASAGATGAGAIVLGGTGVLADVTFADMLFLAAGPEFLGGGIAAASTTGAASASTGFNFGIAARAGVRLGSVQPEKRKAFTLGLEFHTVFVSGSTIVFPALGLGYETF